MSWTKQEEIDRFHEEVDRYKKGEVSDLYFQKFRLNNGAYGLRGFTDKHMVRVKLPLGILDPDKCDAFAEAVEKYNPGSKIAHITTRQAVQIHYVDRMRVADLLQTVAKADMTAREGCGNTIRNVTLCPYAGISHSEPFDVTPYALALTKHFLRNEAFQNLPRKFKIAFESCPKHDHIRVPIHDLGFVPVVKDGVKGFQVYVGGGLGSQPRSAHLLEEFTPLELILPTAETIVKTFDRYGNREDRSKARIKYVVQKMGEEEFNKLIIAERELVQATNPGSYMELEEVEFLEEAPDLNKVKEEKLKNASRTADFEAWKATNAKAQKQKGYVSVDVRCPMGDLTPEQLRGLGKLGRKYTGHMRTTIEQNLVIRWVPEKVLPAVYEALAAINLAFAGSNGLVDITRCPGAETCILAITRSRGVAVAISEKIEKELAADILFARDITIKISGCPNSCGQHHVGTIGLFGNATKGDGGMVPVYRMLVGGCTEPGKATFGTLTAKIPAKATPQAVVGLITWLYENKKDNEAAIDVLGRTSLDEIKKFLEPFAQVPSKAESPEFYEDWDEDQQYELNVGKGECAV